MESVLRDEGFWVAFVVGALGAAAVWELGKRYGWYAGFGCVAAAATIVGYLADHRLRWELLLALVLLGARSLILRSPIAPRVVGGLALLTGAALLAQSLSDRVPAGTKFLVFAAALVLLPPIERVGDRAPRLVVIVLVVSVVGVYACVPDTELARVAVAGFTGAAVLVFDPELGGWTGGASVAAGLLLWLAAAGGYGRPGAVVGAIACAAAVLFLSTFGDGSRSLRGTAAIVPVLFTVFCARVAGFRESAWEAAALVVVAVVVAVVAQRAVGRASAER